MDEIIQEIIRIIEDIAEIPADEISADSHIIDDLDLSSIEIMSVIADVSREYCVDVSEAELMLIQTVSDLASLINEKRR